MTWEIHAYHQQHCYQATSCKERQCECVCHQYPPLCKAMLKSGRLVEVQEVWPDGIWRDSVMEGLWWHAKEELFPGEWERCQIAALAVVQAKEATDAGNPE